MDHKIKEAIRNYVYYSMHTEEARELHLPTVLEALKSGQLQLLDIVVELQGAFTSVENPKQRRLAVHLLSDCLESRPPASLNFKQVDVFVTFFCSKLGDYQCVEGAIAGLRVLLTRHGPVLRTLKSEDGVPSVTSISRSLLKEVHTPSHTQAVRKCMLETAMVLLEDWREEVQQLGSALGEGIAAMVDEERDPRNLLLSFALVTQLMEALDPSCVSKETLQQLFEAMTSYFPITFKPPKGDKIGITPEDLRGGLNTALSSSSRFAPMLIPFLLDSAKDITAGDEEPTIHQAIELLLICTKRFGADVARLHLSAVMVSTHDQMCRTTTPCPDEFANLAHGVLAVAMDGVLPGLQPHWLGKDVDPTLRQLAKDAVDDSTPLARKGARKLLLSVASAHPVLLERVWALSTAEVLKPAKDTQGAVVGPMPQSCLQFCKDLSAIADGKTAPRLAPRQVKPLLAAAIAALQSIQAKGDKEGLLDASNASDTSFVTAVGLVGDLTGLCSEDASEEAFGCLCSVIFKSSTSSPWAEQWREELLRASSDDARIAAAVAALDKVADRHVARASELVPKLSQFSLSAASWAAEVVPRLDAVVALSLARRVEQEPRAMPKVKDENGIVAKLVSEAGKLGCTVVDHLATLCSPKSGSCIVAIKAVGDVVSRADNVGSKAALRWIASKLLSALRLPQELAKFCEGLEAGNEDRLPSVASPFCCFCQSLLETLPADAAQSFRRKALEVAALPEAKGKYMRLALVPAILRSSEEVEDLWPSIQSALKAAEACLLGSTTPNAEIHNAALDAIEAAVKVCPAELVEALLEHFRKEVGPKLGSAAGPAPVRCWACVASALLRRGGCGSQASSFLDGLLSALDGQGSGVAFVPLAFEVLMPPQVNREASQSKLPPLAKQQVALTTLPPLLQRAKQAKEGSPVQQAVLQSCVTILAALPAEAAAADCGEELRWSVVVGLKQLLQSVKPSSDGTLKAVFGVQLLQLLVRAAARAAGWIEDDLNSVLLPLLEVCNAHPVPLVRLGCLQVLSLLIKNSHGHLMTYRKQLSKALRQASEDRRREVRLMAVACVNAWECGSIPDD